jgi:hypothetical protein
MRSGPARCGAGPSRLTRGTPCPGDAEFRAFAIDLLRIEGGRIVELAAFHADLFGAFGLPPVLP